MLVSRLQQSQQTRGEVVEAWQSVPDLSLGIDQFFSQSVVKLCGM
jgi:hypothetical protein